MMDEFLVTHFVMILKCQLVVTILQTQVTDSDIGLLFATHLNFAVAS
jgi:hypothetical protein